MGAVVALVLLWWLSLAQTAWVPRQQARRLAKLAPPSGEPCVVVALTPGSLRFHDNPCLKYVSGQGADCRVLPILWPDDCIPRGIKQSLSLQFNLEGGSLLACSEAKLPSLVAQIRKTYAIQEVVYSRSPAQPFQAHTDRLANILAELGCKGTEVDDSILPTHLGAGYDLKDLTFSQFRHVLHQMLSLSKPVLSYPSLRFPAITREYFPGLCPFLVPHVSAPASGKAHCGGEEESLDCIRRYLSLGDDTFSRSEEFYRAYLSSAPSLELKLALQRLITPPSHSFFPGEVVSALLSNAFAIGSLSPRVAFHTKSATLQQEVVRREWHSFLARVTSSTSEGSRWKTSFYYWNGYLCRMGVMRQPIEKEEPGQELEEAEDMRPDLVFVHGFSGSIDQFTDVARQLLASQRFRSIYAVDSFGFGLSEKPPMSWNQFHWRDHLLDFLHHHLEHNSSRVILAGNSLGGYSVAAAAAELSSLTSPAPSSLSLSSYSLDGGETNVTCLGVILLNPSGEVLPNDRPQLLLDRTPSVLAAFYSLASPRSSPLKAPLVLLKLFGLAIYALLQPRIRQVCRWLYPARPDRVDSANIANHIYRDSCDPGGAGVLASVGKLPPAESMNSLFHRFDGPVLLLQGVLDPMLNATQRAMEFEQMQRPREAIEVKRLRLGHCPMDEDPELVAKEVLDWGAKQQLF